MLLPAETKRDLTQSCRAKPATRKQTTTVLETAQSAWERPLTALDGGLQHPEVLSQRASAPTTRCCWDTTAPAAGALGNSSCVSTHV